MPFTSDSYSGAGPGGLSVPSRYSPVYLTTEFLSMIARTSICSKTIVTGFPIAYQIDDQGYKPDWVFVNPGRFIDGVNSFNQSIGIRVFSGKRGKSGWITTYTAQTDMPIWTMAADTPAFVPWGGRPFQVLLEFYAVTLSPGAGATIEFAVAPIEGR